MGVVIVEKEVAVLGVNVGRTRSIATNGILCVRDGDALFPNDFGQDLLRQLQRSWCSNRGHHRVLRSVQISFLSHHLK